jgi:hypothetical protein
MEHPSDSVHSGLPLPGYRPQSIANLDLVAEGKLLEERMLRYIERVFQHIAQRPGGDPRFAAIGRTDIQKGCMMVYRAIMNPGRITLPEDVAQAPPIQPAVGAIPGEQAENASNSPKID